MVVDKNDVMLDPYVFKKACKDLAFKPTVDLFANRQHQQVPRYFARTSDPESAGRDGLMQDWTKELRPYANTPGR